MSASVRLLLTWAETAVCIPTLPNGYKLKTESRPVSLPGAQHGNVKSLWMLMGSVKQGDLIQPGHHLVL